MAYSPELINRVKNILERVALGGTVKYLCPTFGISQSLFNRIISSDSALSLAYVRAREQRADVDADRIIEIADDATLDPMQARNMIEVRKWRASKQHPTVYGDRIDVNMHGDISIIDTLASARSRLIPRKEQDVLDVELLEPEVLSDNSANEDDIFT